MKKLQSGKVAKLHVVKPATLQPCNPVIFTSGNMPAAPITMKKLQSGKVAKLHVVKPATLQPCNPVIFTSGNMPVGTDNHENSGRVAKLHVVNAATLQPCNPVIFTSGNMPAAPITMKMLCAFASLRLCVEAFSG